MTKHIQLSPVGGIDLPESGKDAVVAGAEAEIRTGLADLDARGEDWHWVHGNAGGDDGVGEDLGWLGVRGEVGLNKDVAAGSLMRQNDAWESTGDSSILRMLNERTSHRWTSRCPAAVEIRVSGGKSLVVNSTSSTTEKWTLWSRKRRNGQMNVGSLTGQLTSQPSSCGGAAYRSE